jgi:hypothetical protein
MFTAASAGKLGLDPCGNDGGNLVGVADGKQTTCLHGVLLPAGSSSCHGCHWPEWRVKFVTTGSVDASPFFIGNAALVFFRTPFLIKERKDYKSSLFPWEPGGNSAHHIKVQGYKETAACNGSDGAYHFWHATRQGNHPHDFAGEIQGIALSCINAGRFCEKKMEINLDTLHPDTNLFPFGTRTSMACPHARSQINLPANKKRIRSTRFAWKPG